MPFDPKELFDLQPYLLGWCRKIAGPDKAEDLCQDTFERALRNIDKFQTGTNLKAWLRTIAQNKHNSDLRREWRGSCLEHEALEVLANVRIGYVQADALTIIEAKQTVLATAFLTADKRNVLFATTEDIDYAEIGERLDIPTGTVKSRAHRARKELANIMDNGSVANVTLADVMAPPNLG